MPFQAPGGYIAFTIVVIIVNLSTMLTFCWLIFVEIQVWIYAKSRCGSTGMLDLLARARGGCVKDACFTTFKCKFHLSGCWGVGWVERHSPDPRIIFNGEVRSVCDL